MTIQEHLERGPGQGAEYAYRIAAAVFALLLLISCFTT